MPASCNFHLQVMSRAAEMRKYIVKFLSTQIDLSTVFAREVMLSFEFFYFMSGRFELHLPFRFVIFSVYPIL